MKTKTIAEVPPYAVSDLGTLWKLPRPKDDSLCMSSWLLAVRTSDRNIFVPYWIHVHRLVPRDKWATNSIAVYVLEQLGNDAEFLYASPPISLGQAATPVYKGQWWARDQHHAAKWVSTALSDSLYDHREFDPQAVVSTTDWVLRFGANMVKREEPRVVVWHADKH